MYMEDKLNLVINYVLSTSDPTNTTINVPAIIQDKEMNMKLYNGIVEALVNDPEFTKIPVSLIQNVVRKNVDSKVNEKSLTTRNIAILFSEVVNSILSDLRDVNKKAKTVRYSANTKLFYIFLFFVIVVLIYHACDIVHAKYTYKYIDDNS